MKNFIKTIFAALILTFAFSVDGYSQTYAYRAFSAAYKYKENGYWHDWTDWQEVSTVITIDYDNDVIRVYAETPQVYVVTNYDGEFTDNSGGQQVQFSVIDQDYDRGKIRLRVEKNGNSQLYVEFADVIFCWNVRKIQM